MPKHCNDSPALHWIDAPNETIPMTPLKTWFDNYSGDHRNPTNQRIHVWCVPAILWSVVAMLWCIPVPAAFGQPGLWAGLSMAAASIYYWQLSRRLEFGMFLLFVAAGVVCWLVSHYLGTRILLRYLRLHARPIAARTGTLEDLARASYAAYNAGPRAAGRFLK